MQIGKDPKSSLILQTIQQLGNSLGLPVVAEGVETREQLQHLVSLGYTQVQGYLYSQAIPWSEVERKYADNPRIPIAKE
jgi:EAL domain-containing protein (putative c-di-GMP-specific phosphodiesterase class I)